MHAFLVLAATTLNLPVTIGVSAINELSIQGSAPLLVITNPIIGPNTVTSNSSTYSITTNGDNKKIVASLDSSLSSDLSLVVSLQAPSGAQSVGDVFLSSQNATLVTNISRVAQSALQITYTFSSSNNSLAGTYSKTVRFTLTD